MIVGNDYAILSMLTSISERIHMKIGKYEMKCKVQPMAPIYIANHTSFSIVECVLSEAVEVIEYIDADEET